MKIDSYDEWVLGQFYQTPTEKKNAFHETEKNHLLTLNFCNGLVNIKRDLYIITTLNLHEQLVDFYIKRIGFETILQPFLTVFGHLSYTVRTLCEVLLGELLNENSGERYDELVVYRYLFQNSLTKFCTTIQWLWSIILVAYFNFWKIYKITTEVVMV